MADIDTIANGLGLTSAQLTQLTQNLATFKTQKLLELDSDVARAKEGMHMTKAGLNLLAKAVAEKELRFSRVAFGDSIKNDVLVEPTDEQIVNYTELIHERNIRLPLADVRFSGNGTAVVTFQVNNSDLETGFWARETGLFALDPDTGAEILYAYKNTGALSRYIPGGGGAVALNLAIHLVTVVDQATNVTAVVDANLLFVTQTELIDHVNSTNPHPNIPSSAPEVTTSDYIWTTGTDTQLHPISSENLSKQLLGDNIYELPRMNSRISQNEINIANLFMQLDAEKNLGLEGNLLLAEDFIDCECIDQLDLKINDEVAGADNVCVEDVEGVLEGHYYTVSDGVRSQYVRVKSVAKNDNLYVVFFDEPLRYTFNLAKAHLFRSTGLIYDNKLGGAGDLRSSTFRFADVWTGESSTASTTLNLTTTNANAANFRLEGDYAFTAAGEFTLAE